MSIPAHAIEQPPLTVDTTIGELLDNPAARAVLMRHAPVLVTAPQIEQARGQSLRAIQPYAKDLLTESVLQSIDADLAREPGAVGTPGKGLNGVAPHPSKAFQLDTLRLWDGQAPLARGADQQDVPTLTVVAPDGSAFNGGAVIVAPGGAYMGLATNHEGRMVADWFAAHGYTAFVLSYRLIPFGYLHPAQLLDAKRAIRWVRAHAADHGLDANRIGMIGFSAGGHLAAMASTLFDAGNPTSGDPVEQVSSRPDFAVLAYPAMSMPRPALEGIDPSASTRRELVPAENVNADTPPTFILHTTADELVPAADSISYYQALTAAQVPAELHIFSDGRHGLGLAMGNATVGAWPSLLNNWLNSRQLNTSSR